MNHDSSTQPLEWPEGAREIEDLKLIVQILSDPFLQEEHRMHTQIRKRRVHHRLAAPVAATSMALAATGAYGYLAITKKSDCALESVAMRGSSETNSKPTPGTIADARGAAKRHAGRPIIPYSETMIVNGRPVPVYGPLLDDEGSALGQALPVPAAASSRLLQLRSEVRRPPHSPGFHRARDGPQGQRGTTQERAARGLRSPRADADDLL